MSNIELINADCIESMKDIPNKSVDMIVCDLPYYKISKNSWDNQWGSLDEYMDWCEKIFIQYKRIAKDICNIFIFSSRQLQHKIATILDKYFIEQRIIIWKRKRAFNATRGKTLSSGYEPISWYSSSETFIFNNIKEKIESKRKEYSDGILKDGVCMSDVWDIPSLPHNSKEKVSHETQKPLKLIERIVQQFSKEGDIVLDNCMGSGTTGVACVNTNRNFIGIEIDKTYFSIAEKRILDAEYKNNMVKVD